MYDHVGIRNCLCLQLLSCVSLYHGLAFLVQFVGRYTAEITEKKETLRKLVRQIAVIDQHEVSSPSSIFVSLYLIFSYTKSILNCFDIYYVCCLEILY